MSYNPNDDEISIIGTVALSFITRKKYLRSLKSENLRKETVKEIWSTEKYYKEQLCTVIDLFLKPMLQMSKESDSWGFKENDIHSIFSHIENIYSLSKLLFERLDPRIQQWTASSCIADIFVDLSPFFRCYKQFSENYSNSIQTLSRIKISSPQFASWLRVREKDPRCKLLDLPSLLIAPIQKVPRYILLLEALAKATHPTHPDQSKCIQASTLLKNIVQVVNDGISEDQNRKKLIALQTIFDNHIKFLGPLSVPNLVEPHRKLVREGRLQKRSFRDQSLQNRHVYLCNDILITVTSIQSVNISKVDKIIPLLSASTIFNSEDDCSFYLISPIKTHQFICESPQSRTQWMIDIQNAILLYVESNPSHKTQRSQWTVVHQDGVWKSVSVLDSNLNTNIKVSNSFEQYHLSDNLDSNNNNNNNNRSNSLSLSFNYGFYGGGGSGSNLSISSSTSTSPPSSPKNRSFINNNSNNNNGGHYNLSKSVEDNKDWVFGSIKKQSQSYQSSFLGPKVELNLSNNNLNSSNIRHHTNIDEYNL